VDLNIARRKMSRRKKAIFSKRVKPSGRDFFKRLSESAILKTKTVVRRESL
jgi:hypothetical protein